LAVTGSDRNKGWHQPGNGNYEALSEAIRKNPLRVINPNATQIVALYANKITVTIVGLNEGASLSLSCVYKLMPMLKSANIVNVIIDGVMQAAGFCILAVFRI